MKDFLSAVVLIFVAEMGDKTQLLAFALSTQYHLPYSIDRCSFRGIFKSWTCDFVRSYRF